jgi:hypothetical protein
MKTNEELLKEIEVLTTCRDHWKNSYYAIHKTIGILLEFHSRWKGVHQGWNQTMRTKRNREAYKLIKEIAEKRNYTNKPFKKNMTQVK